MQKFDTIKYEPLNAYKTKVKLTYFLNNEFVEEAEAECSLPQVICDFDGFNEIEENIGDGGPRTITFSKKLFATFYTNKDHFYNNREPYDYENLTSENPMKENNYAGLFEDIYTRMKFMVGDTVKDVPQEHQGEFLKQIEKYNNPDEKQKFLRIYVNTLLKYEEIRPKVKSFIDEYLKQNPQYKFIRISH
jgi:hypothetical protein